MIWLLLSQMVTVLLTSMDLGGTGVATSASWLASTTQVEDQGPHHHMVSSGTPGSFAIPYVLLRWRSDQEECRRYSSKTAYNSSVFRLRWSRPITAVNCVQCYYCICTCTPAVSEALITYKNATMETWIREWQLLITRSSQLVGRTENWCPMEISVPQPTITRQKHSMYIRKKMEGILLSDYVYHLYKYCLQSSSEKINSVEWLAGRLRWW